MCLPTTWYLKIKPNKVMMILSLYIWLSFKESLCASSSYIWLFYRFDVVRNHIWTTSNNRCFHNTSVHWQSQKWKTKTSLMNHRMLALMLASCLADIITSGGKGISPWLIYEHVPKLMFCSWCQAAGKILSGKNLYVNGTSIFKRDNLMKPNKSKCHMLVEMPT